MGPCNATLIIPKMEQEDAKGKSHKHNKSTKSIPSGGDPQRELVPLGRWQ